MYDSQLNAQAAQVEALHVPVLIDFIPEMTDPVDVSGTLDCFYGAGWENDVGKAGKAYVAAQNHVVNLFRAAGAAKVEWVFAPDGSPFITNVNGHPEWTDFYPGNKFVDWIGLDYYYSGQKAEDFAHNSTINAFYNATSSYGKPLMITQTCAHANASMPAPDPQTNWIQSAVAAMKANEYPAMHGFIYNNNTVRNSPTDGGDTSLALQGPGLDAFSNMAKNLVFGATDPHLFIH